MYTGIALKNLTSLNSSHSFYTGHSYTYNPTGNYWFNVQNTVAWIVVVIVVNPK